jgi:hypothetical protein
VLHYPAQMAPFRLHLYVSMESYKCQAPSEGCSMLLTYFVYSKPLSSRADASLEGGTFSESALDRLEGLMGMFKAAMEI